MDKSIISRDTLAHRARVRKHGLSTSLPSKVEPLDIHHATVDQLSKALIQRLGTTNGIDYVDKIVLFKLWIAVDTELQDRKEALEASLTPMVEDNPACSPYASAYGVDDGDHMEHEAHMVRNIHAECMDEMLEFDNNM